MRRQRMSTSSGSRSASRTTLTCSLGPDDVAADHHRGAGVAVLQQQVAHGADLPRAGLRGRVVDGQHQVGGRGGGEARGDDVPRLEPVGQRDHRIVVSKGRARPGSRRPGRPSSPGSPARRRRATARPPPAPPSPWRTRRGRPTTPPRRRGPARPGCTPAARGRVRRCCRWGGGSARRGRRPGRGTGRSRSGRWRRPVRGATAVSSTRRRRGRARRPRRCRRVPGPVRAGHARAASPARSRAPRRRRRRRREAPSAAGVLARST